LVRSAVRAFSAEDTVIREPAFAGQFYPDDPARLRAEIQRCLAPEPGIEEAAVAAAAIVVPHAAYMYSGRIAGAVYAAARLQERLVILCPNHTGRGEPVAVMSRGGWRTPLGVAPIDETLADRILARCPMATVDDQAHRREHSLEVQLPFLQVLRAAPRFVPICVGITSLPDLVALGLGIAAAIAPPGEPAGIIVSTDMSHYLPAEAARAQDMVALERIEALDPEGLHRVVRQRGISMCGIAPAVAGLTAARCGGARAARLIAYGNSGDASGDYGSVVAYAGLAIS
jgi:AmmeMemoRadiSam system protein B